MATRNRFKVPIIGSVDPGQLQALIERLQGLDKKAGRGAIRKGLDELTKKILDAARGKVPKRSGLLRKALGRKVPVRRIT
ncbi:hypothetical protein [Frigoriglobus tundricola]|uniref:Uncharacterized protein n=1 Tax=Frigoriglobus tundricola TaxID=2774151 RepID=A0A6M5YL90_9BACT|nr:hypothetical protein [Frigoriglobus tundricola]QJW94695.1 hypothetical protein FTUN_2217 [Frigoriglobus tundricola]